MTEREKIIEIVLDTEITGIKIRNITGGISTANAIADALIAAGIGDVKEAKRKAFVYSKEIAYLDKKLKETEHRAEVAERACRIATDKVYDYCYEEAIEQAERELAEEKKDDTE